jgi:hypothetical protein
LRSAFATADSRWFKGIEAAGINDSGFTIMSSGNKLSCYPAKSSVHQNSRQNKQSNSHVVSGLEPAANHFSNSIIQLHFVRRLAIQFHQLFQNSPNFSQINAKRV